MTSSQATHQNAIVLRPKHQPPDPHDPEVGDENSCSGCRRLEIDIIRTFQVTAEKDNAGSPWRALSFALEHIHSKSPCALCRFFLNARCFGRPWTRITSSSYELRVLRARNAVGALNIGLDNTPAFVVVSSNAMYRSNYRGERGLILAQGENRTEISGRQISPRVDVSLIKNWIDFCKSNHADCRLPTPWTLGGFQVMDCSTRTVVDWGTTSPPRQYVSLSYVWGREQGEPTIRQEPLDSKVEVGDKGTVHRKLPNPLPKTIEDAICVTQGLGYRYLWVDRYCIPQDDAKAKHAQLQSMDLIYRHSVLTIIAAAGDDPHHGLPGIGTTPRKSQPACPVGPRSLVFVPFAKNDIMSTTWNSRGWTYQEGLLSRRRLVFTDTQVYFQCTAMHCVECIQAPLQLLHTQDNTRMHDDVDMSRVFPSHGFASKPVDFEACVNAYLTRTLTYDTDILHAFRGVIAAFKRKFFPSMRFVLGVPITTTRSGRHMEALMHGLAWWAPPWEKGSTSERRPAFPSWSWLGWKLRKVSFRGVTDRAATALVDSVFVEYEDGAVLPWIEKMSMVYARDQAGLVPRFLHLHGPARDIRVHGHETGYHWPGHSDDDEVMKRLRAQFDPKFWPSTVEYVRRTFQLPNSEDAPVSFTILLLSKNMGEITALVLYKPSSCDYFERIQSVHVLTSDIERKADYLYGFRPELAQGWPKRDIEIG